MRITIREIQERDFLRLLGFHTQLFEELLRAMSPENREKYLRKQAMRLAAKTKTKEGFVADFLGEALGYLLYNPGPGEFHLTDLYVKRLFRSNGIGRELVRRVAINANNLAGRITLTLPSRDEESYRAARRFYLGLGFELRKGDDYILDKMVLKGRRLHGLIRPKPKHL